MPAKEIIVKTAHSSYPVLVKDHLLDQTGRLLNSLSPAQQAFLISDTNVYALYGKRVTRALEGAGWTVLTAKIKPGEGSKSMAGAMRLYGRAIRADLHRHCVVVALGGGVVGDLAGFVAATYLRGVPLVMVPTTLLAQVDSSVGGKVAVNHPLGKNLIGAFYPPRLVLIDPYTLKTLPLRELKAGLAEVVKYAIIMDEHFFKWLEENIEGLLAGRRDLLSQAVEVCLQAKKKVVEKDEFESGYRRILNFGHTLGHALEAATGYCYYLHGEAVVIGMAVAARFAHDEKKLDKTALIRILSLLEKIGFKKPAPGLTAAQVMDKLKQDKKRTSFAGSLVFILPSRLGAVSDCKMQADKRLANILNDYL